MKIGVFSLGFGQLLLEAGYRLLASPRGVLVLSRSVLELLNLLLQARYVLHVLLALLLKVLLDLLELPLVHGSTVGLLFLLQYQ